MSLDENGVADSCVDYDRNDDENARGLPGGGGWAVLELTGT